MLQTHVYDVCGTQHACADGNILKICGTQHACADGTRWFKYDRDKL
jgi:hypothetical protein